MIMPGIFGGFGCRPELYKTLRSHIEDIWGECESFSLPNVFLGAHAFSGASALHVTADGLHFAVDGESSLYRNAHQFAQKGEPILFRLQNNEIELGVGCKGNVAIVDQHNQILHLATEWTGNFPLYFTEVEGGLLFSSFLRPLARVVKATTDPVGIIQFIRYSASYEGRTCYKGIHRLMAGQHLVFESNSKRLRVNEISKAHVGYVDGVEFGELRKRVWETFQRAIRRCLKSDSRHALMSSAGWDSRLLLAGMRDYIDSARLQGYSHGDINSRELSIVKHMFEALDTHLHLEPLESSMYDLEALQRGFDRAENVVHPFWHRAGVRLSEAGVDCVSAGIFGEVIGGHHGIVYIVGGWDRNRFIAQRLFGCRSKIASKDKTDSPDVYKLLCARDFKKPWYVRSEYWNAIPNINEEINADIEKSIHRYKRRGINYAHQLLEAWTAEYIGAQSWGTQLLSCRAHLNIAIPLGDQELFCLASQIPISLKIPNIITRALVQDHAPELLHFPTAATLVPAEFPITVQEISRLIRQVITTASWKTTVATRCLLRPKFFGWDNFEFLRDGKAFNAVVDNLKSNIVDKSAILERINKLSSIKWEQSADYMQAFNYVMMKIYSTDLMLR
jgi:hypothetical protein